ncbi:MAG TPA: ATP-binding cassette domain-containing protein [Bdellovibrionota bacterium]|nr:ATP-binding cassette domain-containing protein [Bdellovibrionota bacterium]
MDSGLPAIRASELTRELGGVLAVNSVSFEARFGQILGILGPNGAGKTTLLRMLSGLLVPSLGVLEICGRRSPDELTAIKKEVGFLTGTMKLYGTLTPVESLNYLGTLRRMPPAEIRARSEELIAELGMSHFCKKRFARLSAGERQRAQIAATLLHNPRILILDEVTVSLDIMTSEAVLRFVKREKERGKCILFSTHVMSEAEYLCDEILMLHKGRVLDRGAGPALIQRHGARNLTEAFLSAVQGSTLSHERAG